MRFFCFVVLLLVVFVCLMQCSVRLLFWCLLYGVECACYLVLCCYGMLCLWFCCLWLLMLFVTVGMVGNL